MTFHEMKGVHIQAGKVADYANASYWTGDVNADRAEFLRELTISSFRQLATALGFEVKEIEQ